MLAWIHLVQAAGHDRDGLPPARCVQAATVRSSINAQGQAGHHGTAQAADFRRKPQGHARTGRRGVPTANDGHRW